MPDVEFNVLVELSTDERKELQVLMNDAGTSAVVATRARIVLWQAEGRQKKEIAALQLIELFCKIRRGVGPRLEGQWMDL